LNVIAILGAKERFEEELKQGNTNLVSEIYDYFFWSTILFLKIVILWRLYVYAIRKAYP